MAEAIDPPQPTSMQ